MARRASSEPGVVSASGPLPKGVVVTLYGGEISEFVLDPGTFRPAAIAVPLPAPRDWDGETPPLDNVSHWTM